MGVKQRVIGAVLGPLLQRAKPLDEVPVRGGRACAVLLKAHLRGTVHAEVRIVRLLRKEGITVHHGRFSPDGGLRGRTALLDVPQDGLQLFAAEGADGSADLRAVRTLGPRFEFQPVPCLGRGLFRGRFVGPHLGLDLGPHARLLLLTRTFFLVGDLGLRGPVKAGPKPANDGDKNGGEDKTRHKKTDQVLHGLTPGSHERGREPRHRAEAQGGHPHRAASRCRPGLPPARCGTQGVPRGTG